MRLRNLNAGDLEHKVTIKKPPATPTKDSYGGLDDDRSSWSTHATCWAKIETLSGREVDLAQQIVPYATHRVTVWESDATTSGDVTPGMYVSHDSRTLNIGHVNEVNERGVWLELTCAEKK